MQNKLRLSIMAHTQLDLLDVKILQMMSGNARKPFLEIARECGVSGAAVHQRIGKLQSSGVIKGTEMLVEPSAIGYETCAYMGFFSRIRLRSMKWWRNSVIYPR